jgi:SAM-dependent methyltransferase
MSIGDSTQRFSSRVADYVRYRPGYPPEIVQTLKSDCALTAASVIADVGSGTGFLARVFLEHGNRVYGIEPNKEMREAGEQLLKGWPEYISVSGTAEATTLAAENVDFVTAGQAAHWFHLEHARREFLRILRPGGWLVLVWNDRATDSTPLLRAYEQLLQSHCPEYPEVRRIDARAASGIEKFFSPAPMRTKTFPSYQVFDYEGLKGRLLSSSYAPQERHPNHLPMISELRAIFAQHQVDGRVIFGYETRMYYGKLRAVSFF